MTVMVLAWIAVICTYAVLFAAGVAVESWGAARKSAVERHATALYLGIPLGGALLVALLLRSALAPSL